MNIKILGAGCPKCKNLNQAVTQAVKDLALDAEVEKVEDIVKIMSYGVMTTPALVIDERVVFSGRIPSNPELKEIIQKYV